MKSPRNIDLAELGRRHSEEIRSMAAAIESPADSQMWTAMMRPAVRGGKSCGFSEVKDDASNLWTARMRPAIRGGKELVGPLIDDRDDE